MSGSLSIKSIVHLLHVRLGGLVDTIEATQHQKRQHHIARLVMHKGTEQNIVGDLSDKIGFVLKIGHYIPIANINET